MLLQMDRRGLRSSPATHLHLYRARNWELHVHHISRAYMLGTHREEGVTGCTF